VVASVSWPTYLRSSSAEATTFFSNLGGESGPARAAEADGFRAALLAAAPAERTELLLAFTRRHLASVVGIDDPNELALDTRFAELGMDSLLALDLRTLLERGLGTTLTTTMIFDHPTLEALVSYLDGLLPSSTATPSPQASA
jgi:acyl carrier protein